MCGSLLESTIWCPMTAMRRAIRPIFAYDWLAASDMDIDFYWRIIMEQLTISCCFALVGLFFYSVVLLVTLIESTSWLGKKFRCALSIAHFLLKWYLGRYLPYLILQYRYWWIIYVPLFPFMYSTGIRVLLRATGFLIFLQRLFRIDPKTWGELSRFTRKNFKILRKN